MAQDTTNLFRRRDTFFGICEGVGQDFGFNPLWLRLAFIAPLFFFPIETVAAYFGLGLIVLASRLVFPARAAAERPAIAEAASPANRRSEQADDYAIAA